MTGDSEMKSSINEESEFVDVDFYRKLVRNFIDMRRYSTALFWAEKVCQLSLNDPNDVYWHAQCMFLMREYHRAAHIIKFHSLEKTHVLCHFLAVESLLEAKEYNEAIDVLNSVDVEDMTNSVFDQGDATASYQLGFEEGQRNEIFASIAFLKGKVFEAMDNRALAMDCYVEALQISIFCTEALDALVQHEMLRAWEEKELMHYLPFSQQCSEADTKIIKTMYESKLKKYYQSFELDDNADQTPIGTLKTIQTIKEQTDKIDNNHTNEVKINKSLNSKISTPTESGILSPANKILEDLRNTPTYSLQSSLSRFSLINQDSNRSKMDSSQNYKAKFVNPDSPTALSLNTCLERIQGSVDLMAAEAEKLFYDCEYKNCLKILDELLRKDPYHNGGLTVLIGTLVEMKDFNKLFFVAHKLVDLYPDKAISWYAVGCYYDLIGKSDHARRYLFKATSLDRLYGPAWLAYGHSFARENEHDQAMAAYFKATQLMRGCHLPLLYIGVECGLTKNLELAEKFFYQAMSIAPLDIFVLHELAVIKFEYEFYESAEEVFRTTADIICSRSQGNREAVSARWEPLFSNLGHCCRKNKKYKEALEFHQLALVLRPQNAETYTAIGFVYALMGELEKAIEFFHKSLSFNRDSVVTATILKTCIEDLMEEDSISDDLSIEDISDADPPKSPAKTPDPENDEKLNCVQLKFDDSGASPCGDALADKSCDMSLDD